MFATILWIEIYVEANKILLYTFKKEYKISCHYDLLFFLISIYFVVITFAGVNKCFMLSVMRVWWYQLCFLFGFLQSPSNYKCNQFNYINMLDIIQSDLRPAGSIIQPLTELKFLSRKEESSRGWYSIRNTPNMQGSMGHFHSMKATFFWCSQSWCKS